MAFAYVNNIFSIVLEGTEFGSCLIEIPQLEKCVHGASKHYIYFIENNKLMSAISSTLRTVELTQVKIENFDQITGLLITPSNNLCITLPNKIYHVCGLDVVCYDVPENIEILSIDAGGLVYKSQNKFYQISRHGEPTSELVFPHLPEYLWHVCGKLYYYSSESGAVYDKEGNMVESHITEIMSYKIINLEHYTVIVLPSGRLSLVAITRRSYRVKTSHSLNNIGKIMDIKNNHETLVVQFDDGRTYIFNISSMKVERGYLKNATLSRPPTTKSARN